VDWKHGSIPFLSRQPFYYNIGRELGYVSITIYLYICIYTTTYIWYVNIYIYKSLREDNEGRRIGNVGNVGNIGIC
jgi:hypothetical protein